MKNDSLNMPFFSKLPLLMALFLIFSCSENRGNNTSTETNSPKKESIAESITINGIVKDVRFGKDGYSAEVQTDAGQTYIALVSIVNVGGREKYKTCSVGDNVSFKGDPSVLGGVQQLKVTEILQISPTQTQLLISPIAFRGIQVGDLLANHKDYTQKKQWKTAEGTFDVYEIKDFENNPAGYILPDPSNKLLVGDITVQSPKARTAKGIKIGDTFQDLVKIFPDIEVHGSEIGGRTNASANNLSYRLDITNFSYKIDRAKIPGATKITEITVNRGATAKALILEAKKGHN